MVFFRRLRMRWRARRFERKLRDAGVLPVRPRHPWRVRRSSEQRSLLLLAPRCPWLRAFSFTRAAQHAQQLAPLGTPITATGSEGTAEGRISHSQPSSNVSVDRSEQEDAPQRASRTSTAANETESRAFGGDFELVSDSTADVAQLDAETILQSNRELLAEYGASGKVLSSSVATARDVELFRENERLKRQVVQLQRELERAREVSLLSATVIGSRIANRGSRQVVEYELRLETDIRGTLVVWHRYSTFCNLVSTLQTKNGYKPGEIPELPRKQVFGNYSEKTIQERVIKLNEFLEAATKAEHLQFGVRVDADTCVYKRRAKKSSTSSSSFQSQSRGSPPPPVAPESAVAAMEGNGLARENARLKQEVANLQTRLARSKEVALLSAKVVDSRITWRNGRQFVEYKIQIESNTRGTLFVWHRYSTFLKLAGILKEKDGYKPDEFPELREEKVFGSNYTESAIQQRMSKLNEFLAAAINAEQLQWGIRVDADTCVYKRRVKKAPTTSSAVSSNNAPRSLRQSALSRLWLRHLAKRGSSAAS